MAALSDYLETALIEHIFGNTNFTRPATLYVALFTATPSDSGGGTEVSGNAYARQGLVTGASSVWTRSAAVGSNTNVITFPVATPSGWGTITHVGIFDASSGGNLLFWGALTASKSVGAGDQFTFQAAQLALTIDN